MLHSVVNLDHTISNHINMNNRFTANYVNTIVESNNSLVESNRIK